MSIRNMQVFHCQKLKQYDVVQIFKTQVVDLLVNTGF